MRFISKGILLTFLGLTITSMPVMALLVGTPLPRGWYIEGNYGASKSTNIDYPGITTVKNSGTGWNGSAGYKINPYVGIEGGYTRYANVRLLNSEGTTVAKNQHYAIDAAVKGMLPIPCSGVEFFAKVGVSRISASLGSINQAAADVDGITVNAGNKASFGPYGGVGIDYSFTPYLQVNAQFARSWGNNSTGNLDLASLGLSYILG